MANQLHLHEDRLFPAEPSVRAIARRLYAGVRDLPILSPHGHTDPQWFAGNERFTNATELLLAPDHYLYRMLFSQGIDLEQLGVPSRRGASSVDPRRAWGTFAEHFHLFHGTPSSLWLNYVGADVPQRTEYVHALQPLLDRFGNDKRLSVILFTLDESSYSRELAPLAGHYPILKLGPAWWFHDSPQGMLRFREHTTETAGFYNAVGFNDDTRAFLSIPARHDLARRVDCTYLARLVAEHRLEEDSAVQIAADLAYRLPKQAYKL